MSKNEHFKTYDIPAKWSDWPERYVLIMIPEEETFNSSQEVHESLSPCFSEQLLFGKSKFFRKAIFRITYSSWGVSGVGKT